MPVIKAMRQPTTVLVSGDMARALFTDALSRLWRSLSSPWSRARAEPPHIETGRRGEDIAARYLRRKGYKILYRNYRARHGGEVDIVCRDRAENTLVFVEVKTRSTAPGPTRPRDAVDRAKQYLVAKAAMSWLTLLDKPDVVFRFDIVEVVLDEPEPVHIREAFHLPYHRGI